MRFLHLWMIAILLFPISILSEEQWNSTRVTDLNHHKRTGPRSYPYRQWEKFILKELDIQSGDAVLDIGAGDGWWSERFAKELNGSGKIYASEVDEEKVESMKEKFADIPLIEPYLSESDTTGLDENSCDLAFFSQVYHHLNEGGHEDYLKHLKTVVKPTGRVCIIERYKDIAVHNPDHTTKLSTLVKHAEDTGWILVRYELMRGTNHYLTIFAQKDLFSKPEEKNEER